jgi:clan AA aspartic protease (TIGR02281 family)
MNEQPTLETFLAAQGYASLQMHKSAIGHFEVQGKIEDNEVLLLVDTGASKTVMDARSAETLALQANASEDKAAGFGTTEGATAQTAATTLQIGPLPFPSFTLYVLDLDYCNAGIEANGGQRIDGIIEADILGQRQAIIDYGGAKLYLKKVK